MDSSGEECATHDKSIRENHSRVVVWERWILEAANFVRQPSRGLKCSTRANRISDACFAPNMTSVTRSVWCPCLALNRISDACFAPNMTFVIRYPEHVPNKGIQKLCEQLAIPPDSQTCELVQLMNYICGCSGAGYGGADTERKGALLAWLPRVMAILCRVNHLS
jgi:hypothetical protein